MQHGWTIDRFKETYLLLYFHYKIPHELYPILKKGMKSKTYAMCYGYLFMVLVKHGP